MSNYDYCKLYIETDRSFDELKLTISRILNSPLEGRTVRTCSMLVDCFKNNARRDQGEGFLYWPYYLEVEAVANSMGAEFVRNIQSLIDSLKLEAMRIVPSCDFEDRLKF